VHHGRNPKYIDRNHGGTLIVWDRLFGTYQAEEEEVAYGITTPLRSWNPVWANLHYWVELWGKARRTARPLDKVRMFLKRPGWHPDDLGGFQAAPDVSGQPARQYETPVPRGLGAYILVQFVGVLLASSILLFRQAALSRGALLGGAVLLGISVLAIGGLFERRRWAFVLEGLRLLAMAGWAVYWLYDRAPAAAVTVVATVAAGALLVWLQRYRSFFAVHSHV
jgi:hypothetical protein